MGRYNVMTSGETKRSVVLKALVYRFLHQVLVNFSSREFMELLDQPEDLHVWSTGFRDRKLLLEEITYNNESTKVLNMQTNPVFRYTN